MYAAPAVLLHIAVTDSVSGKAGGGAACAGTNRR